MIRVAIMYPNAAGSRFDVDYYRNTHLPLARRLLGSALLGIELDVAAGKAPYHAIGYLIFDSMAGFQAAFAKAQAELGADVPNYTDVEPAVQISNYEKV